MCTADTIVQSLLNFRVITTELFLTFADNFCCIESIRLNTIGDILVIVTICSQCYTCQVNIVKV